MAAGVLAAAVHLHRQRLGEEGIRHAFEQRAELLVVRVVLAAEGALVGEDQVDVPAPAQRAVHDQAFDRGEVVRFEAEAVVVELRHRDVGHHGRVEAIQSLARRGDAHGLVFEPGLVRGDLELLAWHLAFAGEGHDRLPRQPREFVVVPDAHERPARTRVLQVGIDEVALVQRAVVVERTGHGEAVVGDLAAVLVRHRERDLPIVAMPVLDLVRRLDDLVDEIAQVQHEAEALVRRRALVLEDHLAVRVHRALGRALAADEGELRGARVVGRRRGQRAADAAAVAVFVDEAVPELAGRRQLGDQHAAGPVGGREHRWRPSSR